MKHDDCAPVQVFGITRRRLVKTGAHAAWVVPAVTLVSTAPAFARSGVLGVVLTGGRNAQNGLDVNATITNSDADQTAAFRVILTFRGQFNISTSSVLITPAGFTATSRRVFDGTKAVEFIFTADSQLAGNGASIMFNTRINSSPDGTNVQSGSLTLVADPGGAGTTGMGSFSY